MAHAGQQGRDRERARRLAKAQSATRSGSSGRQAVSAHPSLQRSVPDVQHGEAHGSGSRRPSAGPTSGFAGRGSTARRTGSARQPPDPGTPGIFMTSCPEPGPELDPGLLQGIPGVAVAEPGPICQGSAGSLPVRPGAFSVEPGFRFQADGNQQAGFRCQADGMRECVASEDLSRMRAVSRIDLERASSTIQIWWRYRRACKSRCPRGSGLPGPSTDMLRPDQVDAASGYQGQPLDAPLDDFSQHLSQQKAYCPKRYEDPPASGAGSATGSGNRVAQLRSKIRSLQDLRGQAGSEASFLPEPREPSQEHRAATQAMPSAWPSESTTRQAGRPPVSSQRQGVLEPGDKLSSILSFLDEVEESSRADICSIVSSARSSKAPGDVDRLGLDLASAELPSTDAGRGAGAGRAVPSCLAGDALALHSRVSLLEVEVNDKKQIIGTLKQALAETKEREKQAVQEVAREWQDKLDKQKAHYESSLERQLKLVDRLLNDKTELTKRCELFSEELKAVERKFQMKMEELEEQSSKELSRQKQNWMAAEKLRREAWEKDKTREIKEITIKGLQPEVERILAERKQERQKLDERHKEMMESQRQELSEMGQAQVREARAVLLKEQEHLIDQERERHQRKLRDEFDKFSVQLQEERTKCAADLLAERRKYEQLLKQSAQDFETRLGDAVAAERAKGEAAVQGAKSSASDTEERHRADILSLQERYRDEKEHWQREHLERAQAELERREAALRDELTKERDRQLEMVVDRLGREHVEQQRSIKDDSAIQIERVRSEASEEARRLSTQVEEAKTQLASLETQRALAEQTTQGLQKQLDSESQRSADLESQVRNLEAERGSIRRDHEQGLEKHRDELWRVCEMKDKEIEAARSEVLQLNKRVSQEQQRAEEDRKEAKNREEKIISDLEARVKRTLQAKDDAISELRTRCAASENKVREFEYLLARQREELLSGITRDALS